MGARNITQLPGAGALAAADILHVNQSLYDKQTTLDAISKYVMQGSAYAPLLVFVNGTYSVPISGPRDVWVFAYTTTGSYTISLPAIAASNTPIRVHVILLSTTTGQVSVAISGGGTYVLNAAGNSITVFGGLTAASTYGWVVVGADLNTASSIATPLMLLRRDAAGRAQVVDPSAAADISTKAYVDSRTYAQVPGSYNMNALTVAGRFIWNNAGTTNFPGTGCAAADVYAMEVIAGQTPSNVIQLLWDVTLGPTSYCFAWMRQSTNGGSTWSTWVVQNAPPIGFVYEQAATTAGVADATPASLFPGTTWANVSSEEAGCFRRAEGGNATAFLAGQQSSANISHNHGSLVSATDPAHNHGGWSSYQAPNGYSATGAFASMQNGGSKTNDSLAIQSASISHQHTISADGATEARPVNITVRKWRRTA